MFYALAAAGGAAACYLVLHLPLKAKVNQVKTIIANELHGATVATQNVLQRIAKAL